MGLIEKPEILEVIAKALGTTPRKTVKGRIDIDGQDTAGNIVCLSTEPVTPVVEVCTVSISYPTGSLHHVALLVNGQVTLDPVAHTVQIEDRDRGNLFSVGLRSPAVIIQSSPVT